jgi:diguanylate cyclase (GGDEF)-like protein/PAS domain S-box-containing protein
MSTNVHYLKKGKSNFRREYEYRKFFFEKNATAMYLVSAPEGTIDNCNDAFVQLLGFDSNLQVLGRRLSEFFDNTADYDSFIARFHNSDRITGDQECLRKKDGSILWILQDLYVIPDLGTNETNILGTVMDITDQKMEEENLQRGALYDSLTSLPNRSLFLDRLTAIFHRAHRIPDCQFAVLFLNLNRFKWVYDTFGHHLGDELLRAAAKRLGAKIRSVDTVARLGGDEFAVLVSDVHHASDATRVAARIEAAFQNPFRLDDREISIRVSIGIALSFIESASSLLSGNNLHS